MAYSEPKHTSELRALNLWSAVKNWSGQRARLVTPSFTLTDWTDYCLHCYYIVFESTEVIREDRLEIGKTSTAVILCGIAFSQKS